MRVTSTRRRGDVVEMPLKTPYPWERPEATLLANGKLPSGVRSLSALNVSQPARDPRGNTDRQTIHNNACGDFGRGACDHPCGQSHHEPMLECELMFMHALNWWPRRMQAGREDRRHLIGVPSRLTQGWAGLHECKPSEVHSSDGEARLTEDWLSPHFDQS